MFFQCEIFCTLACTLLHLSITLHAEKMNFTLVSSGLLLFELGVFISAKARACLSTIFFLCVNLWDFQK